MNGTPSNERLSAWLDNELSPEERAEVDELLADSPELRQEADELRRLSSHLKGLPTTQAPADLQQAVMQSIQRETQPAGSGLARPARQGRLLRVLATAAGVVIAAGAVVWLAGNGGQQMANTDPVQPEIVQTQQNRLKMAANKADLRNEKKKLSVELPSRQFEIDRGKLDSADIGDIVEAVRRDGESVSIVRLTVVDREAGLESLRVLLAHQDIPLDGSTEAAPGSNDLSSRGMVAVFVESESKQLSHTIEQMARQLDLEALSVSDSLPIAELDSGVRSELGLANVNESRASRAISVPEGSSLEKIITEPGSYSSISENSAKPASDDKPVRVIFVLSNAPQNKPAAETSVSENGAA